MEKQITLKTPQRAHILGTCSVTNKSTIQPHSQNTKISSFLFYQKQRLLSQQNHTELRKNHQKEENNE